MENIRILKYSTNTWLTSKNDIMNALNDIIDNNSNDYSFNKGMAQRTIKHFRIKL